MSNSLLPSGWSLPTLAMVADVSSGIGFPNEFQGNSTGDLPFYKVSDVSFAVKETGGILCSANHYVSYAIAVRLKGRPLRVGTTVFAKIGEAVHLNRRAFVSTPCLIDNNVMAVKARFDSMDRYLHYFLKTIELGEYARSTTVPSLRKGDVESLLLPLAPEAEQTRIANQLDTLLTRVQACNGRFDAIPALLKRFRQTVLDACLLDDQLAVPVEKSIQPWALRNVGSVCASISDGPFGSNLKSADYTSAGVQVVRLENIDHLFFDAKKETFVSAEKYRTLSKHTLNKGDLLFSSFVDEEVRVCEFSLDTLTINKADCFRLRVDETQCNRHFLLYRLACKTTYQSLKAQVHGATRPRINLTQLRGYEILLPPLAKQTEIVRRIEALFALADRIEACCTAARAQAQRLTPLVLAKAFRGELVSQDPNDEPASALLARIASASTAVPGKSKRKAPVALKEIAQAAITL